MLSGIGRQVALAIAAGALVAGCAETGGARYPTPENAVASLMAAVRADSDEQLAQVFGADAAGLLASGDPVSDSGTRARFVELYDEGHHIEQAEPGTATLFVGPDDWPFPVPLVRRGADWTFDTASGIDEIVNRRIGRNELDSIETCRAIVDAQREYAALEIAGHPKGAYARYFLSRDPAAHDGLYWPTAPGEPDSPLGQLVADAQAEGYALPSGEQGPQPYHGYLYRVLEKQGPNAPGGAAEYLVDGRLTRGFAVVAWPVEYGNSGIMTFLVAANGIVYESDLGEDTARIAGALEAYDPDAHWAVSE